MTHNRGSCAQESEIPCFNGQPHLEARFECPICLQCMRNPILTACGHRFCSDCITDWLRQKDQSCPIDSLPINQETDLFPDNFTRREIQELDLHSSSCSYEKREEVQCTFHDVGCTEILTKNSLAEHLKSQVHQHLDLLRQAHMKARRQNSVEEKLKGKAQEAALLWAPDSKGESTEKNGETWQALARDLFGRIVVLEQKYNEHEIQLSNIKQQLQQHVSNSSAVLEEICRKHCGGVMLWAIPEFRKELNTMEREPAHYFLYSPSFYTSPNGYRFCARLNISPKDHNCLSLLIHLMKTDHDVCLDWPFTGRISFRLVNMKDSQLHIQETMMSRPEIDAFQQPTKNINPRGFGYTEFISIPELMSAGFIHNDTLTIKIKVQSV
ncbi:TNF receptor-associated factor 6-B [Schistocerca piceifrons]|uniref:TNF receptor-associated factor 6-B n=1 Tax=Schistocerca piceifrons TaxID=274613 RepID=UPI001F5E6C42|nr:TNF receptor-associated factor 6-B [Schistocerca piceifrons]